MVVGHSFPTISSLLLRIAEEANLRFIPMSIICSNNCQLLVVSDQFHVHGSCSDKHRWVATIVFCCLDDPGEIPVVSSPARAKKVETDDNSKVNVDNDDSSFTTKRRKSPKPCTPFHEEWLVPLIKFMIESNQTHRMIRCSLFFVSMDRITR